MFRMLDTNTMSRWEEGHIRLYTWWKIWVVLDSSSTTRKYSMVPENKAAFSLGMKDGNVPFPIAQYTRVGNNWLPLNTSGPASSKPD